VAISPKQLAAVIALPGLKRFEHFVKVVADREQVWGLYQEGWAAAGTEDEASVFPIWPAKEYAEACALGEWSGYEPKAIDLGEFLGVFLPNFEEDGILPGVFYVPSGGGVTPSVDDLRSALEAELSNY